MKEYEIIPPSTNLKSNLFALCVTTLTLIGLTSIKSKPFFQLSGQSTPESRKDIEIKWTVQPFEKDTPEANKFIEANPKSPDNPPDETNHFSFRDQQAAQPNNSPDLLRDDLPKLDGVEFSSKVTPSAPESPALKKIPFLPDPAVQKLKNQEAQKDAMKVTPKNMQIADTHNRNKDGLKVEKQNKDGQEKVINLSKKHAELESDSDNLNLAALQTPKPSSIATRPRPRLSPELLRGPIMKTISSAPRVGMLAVECRLHPYGVYVQEMLRSVEDQWHHLAHGSLQFLQLDKMKAKITYRFTLQADGKTRDLEFLGSGDGALPAELCRQAIASRVPFGEWTQKMIDDFGQTDEITIHFNYR